MNIVQSHITDVSWIWEKNCVNLSVFQPFNAYLQNLTGQAGTKLFLIGDNFDKIKFKVDQWICYHLYKKSQCKIGKIVFTLNI